MAFCRSLNESEDGCTCVVCGNGVVGCVIGDNYAFVAMFLYVVARQIVLNGVIQWSIDISRGQSGLASVELEVCHPSVVHLFAVGGGTFDVGNEFVINDTFHRYEDTLCLIINDNRIAKRVHNRSVAGDCDSSATLSRGGTDIVRVDCEMWIAVCEQNLIRTSAPLECEGLGFWGANRSDWQYDSRVGWGEEFSTGDSDVGDFKFLVSPSIVCSFEADAFSTWGKCK